MNSFSKFLEDYPTYSATSTLDDLRATEFARLDGRGHVYLDYTGAGLYTASQLCWHTEMLVMHVLGNPHSASPSSTEMTRQVEHTRASILKYFNGTDNYTAVFTLNASGAIKLITEAYPFGVGGRLLLSMDNHNSVHGIRKFASAKGAAIDYTRLTRPDLRIDMPAMEALLVQAGPARSNLLAFPAQSNFSGVKHPLSLVDTEHHKGWDVLLDAAAFVPTNRLDLQLVTPDFMAVSFYRVFGDPTGVGCLLIRNSALGKLKRHWFASWHGEFRNGSRAPACSGTRRSGI